MIGRNLAVLAVLGAGVLCGAEKIELNSVNAWERQYGVTEKRAFFPFRENVLSP